MSSLRCSNGSSTARSFFLLARRTYSTTSTRSSFPLDFLVPPHAATSLLRTSVSSGRSVFGKDTSLLGRGTNVSASKTSSRSFTVSANRLATVCVRNPQKDEDGNDMMLEITPRAAKRLSKIMTKDENPNLALRIQVESGGCHGFQYLMSLVTLPPRDAEAQSSVLSEDDSIFEYVPENEEDKVAQNAVPKIILDEPSLELLKGSKVDFTVELIGSEFKIVDNPLATSSCGCGTSFDIKM